MLYPACKPSPALCTKAKVAKAGALLYPACKPSPALCTKAKVAKAGAYLQDTIMVLPPAPSGLTTNI